MSARRSPPPILLYNIGQLLTLTLPSRTGGPRQGAELSELGILRDAAVLCAGGKIVSVGTTQAARRDAWIRSHRRLLTEIDCEGRVVLPGFVDSHTHPVFVSPRLVDFEQRIAGTTYEEIAAAGGGIRASVAAVRAAAKADLARRVLHSLNMFGQHGTTTVEAKSGYGLSPEAELKSLVAIRDAAAQWPGTVWPTLLGAHVVPAEFSGRPDDYVRLVCEEMIPNAAKRKLAAGVDVFCDRGAFSEEQSLRVLAAARRHGLSVRAHVSQLAHTPVERILSLSPLSLDHLDRADARDLELLAKSATVATLIPGANYFLGTREYPPARKLMDAGVAVALASDYNPGSSPTPNMQFVLSLACTQMKMTPAEAISAATINGACALGLAHRKGSIEPGKDADLAVFDMKDHRELGYWFGTNLCRRVIANGITL